MTTHAHLKRRVLGVVSLRFFRVVALISCSLPIAVFKVHVLDITGDFLDAAGAIGR